MGSLRFFLLVFASVIFGDKGNGKCYAAASVEAAKGLCQESLIFAQAGDPSTCLAWAAQGFSNPCRAPLQYPSFLSCIWGAMSGGAQTGWKCGTCKKMRSPNAWYCDLCGQSWEVCQVPAGHTKAQSFSAHGSAQHWQDAHQRTKSPRPKRQRSCKKQAVPQWNQQGQPHLRQDQGGAPWSGPGSWPPANQSEGKGLGKGFPPFQMNIASPPPPPPPMLMAPPVPHGVPWMQQPMPMMPVPYMPPTVEPHVAAQSSNAVEPSNTAEALQAGMTAQRKLSKIMKAVKKEDNLSPEFQQLVHTELKHEEKESTDTLLDAVKELGHAKDALLEVESARLQLWSQWRVFLQQSVIKWREYTTQFQTSEAVFHAKMQEATNTLRRAQRKVDWAKKSTDTIKVDGVAQVISDDDMDEQEPKDEEELPRDENAQRIQEGLNQVVTSLVDLWHNAEKLEPKPKRPRTKEEEDIAGPRASQPSMQPFAKADTEYDRQRPGLSDSSHAVFLHWRHSVLQESTFMSPWAAIEVAFDLAAELGTSSRIRVDEITFSSTTSCRKQVSFDANVLVFQGKESGKFHPHWTCINDRPARQVPQASRGEDSGRSATSPQGQGSSAGSTQTTHFLDRRLPDEVPGYVHHLQHLWRDELIRLPPGQPYRVRSWYIHHTHQQVWKIPRYIDLHGDGTFWHRDLLVQ